MQDPTTGPARDAGLNDELADILQDCAQRVPGSLDRLLARYDEHLRTRVGSTLADAALAGPRLGAALTAAYAEAAEFDPARETAEAWLDARVRPARVATSLIPFSVRTGRRAGGGPSDSEAVPVSPATTLRPQEGRLRVVAQQSDGRGGDDGEPGPAAPDGNDSSVSRDGGAGRGNADARRVGPAADPPPPDEEVDYRWVADYQRAEIRSLEARIGELERRLRLRTVALSTTLALAGLGVIGGAYLAVGPLVKPEPAQAARTATGTGPGGRLAGTADPAAKAQVPGPEPGAEPPNPPAEVREAGPLPSPEAGPPVRAESSGADERPAAPTVGDTAERTALEKLEAKDPSAAGTANGATRSDANATGGTAAGAAAPQSPPNATRDDAVGAAAVPHAAAASPENEAGGRQTEAPPPTPPGQGGGEGSGAATAAAPPTSQGGGGDAEGGASGAATPPSTAVGTGPAGPAGNAAVRRTATAPPVPVAAPRGPAARAGRPDRGAGGGNAAAEALRSASGATRRSLGGPGDGAGEGATPPQEPASGIW